MRCAGKDYEEYYNRARDCGIIFLRGHVGKIKEDPTTKDLLVQIEAFNMEHYLEMKFELIVLSSASIPSKYAKKIKKILALETSRDGFFKEVHSRLNLIDTKIPGICIAGAAQGPKSIPEAIIQGRAAASSLSGIMNKDKYEILLIRGYIDNHLCSKCGLCQLNCPYNAITINNNHAEVNEITCKGCGTCLANCPSEAITLKYYREAQYEEQIDAILFES
ncbi:MAG: 4Fe-4S binding protein [Promethearchaeota archaeon]